MTEHVCTRLKPCMYVGMNMSNSSFFFYQVMTSAQKKGPRSMAMFLVFSGGDLTIINISSQTPLQLCAHLNLIKLLGRAQQEHNVKEPGDEANTVHQLFTTCGSPR